jgi:prevent-host-death family protein
MDEDRYSTYDAKTRFSELIRKVRAGRSVTITYRGKPVAEVRPIDPPGSTEARIERLAERGLVTSEPARRELRPLVRRPGALERFLKDRDEG